MIQRYALAVFYYDTELTFFSEESGQCSSYVERFLGWSDEWGWYGVSWNAIDRVNALKL